MTTVILDFTATAVAGRIWKRDSAIRTAPKEGTGPSVDAFALPYSWTFMYPSVVARTSDTLRSPQRRSVPVQIQLECGPMPNVMAAQPNIAGALCEGSVIPFPVPRHKVRLTAAARVPCSNAANIGEGKN